MSRFKAYQKAPEEKRFQLNVKLKNEIERYRAKHPQTSSTDANTSSRLTKLTELEKDLKQDQQDLMVARVGLPPEYVDETSEGVLETISLADRALAKGDLKTAHKWLELLRTWGIPGGEFNLIKSNLIRAHIDKINPQLAQIIGTESFEQQDEGMMRLGTGTAKATHKESFTNNLEKWKKDQYTTITDDKHTGSIGPDLAGYSKSLLNQHQAKLTAGDPNSIRPGEKKFTDMAAFDKLSPVEKYNLSEYTSGTYKNLNANLRQKTLAPDKKGGLSQGAVAYSQNVVSAINKLPPYKGKVYRHGNFFGGFKELNRKGAVLSDLAFASTTFRPESLQEQFGKDYTEIIESKTGRWIKPISQAPGEDEVLLKPGTRLRVIDRYDKDPAAGANVKKGWAKALPEVKRVIAKDPIGPKIQTVVLKEEV